MAQGIFNKLAAENGIDVIAESFGLQTITGCPVSENSVKVCNEIEVDISKLRSTSVQDADLDKYSKFFCMSQRHCEFLRVCCGVKPERLAVLNVSDPYGGNEQIYRACRDEIYNSVKEIINSLKAERKNEN